MTSPALHTLRVLHLSDLHEPVILPDTDPESARFLEFEDDSRREVLGPELIRAITELPRPDLVVFTGDLADRGLPQEYAAAYARLAEILKALDLGWERLFLVPGNHDLQRGVEPQAWGGLREFGMKTPDLLDAWMAGMRVPELLQARGDLPSAICARTAAYRSLIAEHRPALDPALHFHKRLGYRAEAPLGLPFPVHIIGLDSSWLCGGDDDAGHIRLLLGQLTHGQGESGETLPGLRLALMHHPPHELADGLDCVRELADECDLLLHGHVHESIASELVDPDRRLRVLAAGSLYAPAQGGRGINGFQLLTLHMDEQGHPLELELDLRAWSHKAGHWHPDGSVYRIAKNGHLKWAWDGERWQLPGAGSTPRQARHERSLRARILEEEERRASIERSGGDTSEIDQEILRLRRERRQGPLLGEGEILKHRWELVEELKPGGGWAYLWRARDRRDGREVAVKVLKGEIARDPSRLERFRSGARYMRELSMQGIVPIYEQDQDDGFHFVAMEYLPGGDLSKAVLSGAISGDRALDVVLEVGQVLQRARALKPGLLHRDIKPANILLDEHGRAWLTDFDLGTASGETGGTKGNLGTLVYAAPEQMDDAASADERADVYGLAMTAVFCLYGKEIRYGMIPEMEDFTRRLPVGRELREVLARGVSWKRERRYDTVGELCWAIEWARKATVFKDIEFEKGGKNWEARRKVIEELHVTTGRLDLALDLAWKVIESSLNGNDLFFAREYLRAIARGEVQGDPGERDLAELRRYAGDRAFRAIERHRALHDRNHKAAMKILERQFVRVPAGNFEMGSPEYEEGRYKDEGPVHTVTLTRPFEMQRVPVTHALYECFDPGHREDRPRFEGLDPGDLDDHPCVNVTFYEALVFAEWLGSSLPTEAEWEYACRAGTRTPYYNGTGEDALRRAGWYAGNSTGRTWPAGRKLANLWGLYDMHGNVWEWCLERWKAGHSTDVPSVIDPCHPGEDNGPHLIVNEGRIVRSSSSVVNQGASNADLSVPRVVRGGSWNDRAEDLRAACCDKLVPWYRFVNLGFRVVRRWYIERG